MCCGSRRRLMIFIFLKSEALFSHILVSVLLGCRLIVLWGYPSIFFFFTLRYLWWAKSYYDLHRGYHEKRVCIYLPRSLPSQPSTPPPPPHPHLHPMLMFWIVWRWTASCLLRWMPTVSRCPVRLWQAARVDELPASTRWHLCICSVSDHRQERRGIVGQHDVFLVCFRVSSF